MFRFSIRELLLFTLVAAVGIGWLSERLRSSMLESALDSSRADSRRWSHRAQATASMLKYDGWSVNCAESNIEIHKPSERIYWSE